MNVRRETVRIANQPGPPTMLSTLEREVQHYQERLDKALEDLRNWKLSHPEELGKPKSE